MVGSGYVRRLALDVFVLALALMGAHGAWIVFDLFSVNVDFFVQYRWTSQFLDALNQGVAFPAWVPASRGGLGDPVFVYYVSGFYYLAALALPLTGSVWGAIKLVCLVAAAVCGTSVLAFARAQGMAAPWARLCAAAAILTPTLIVVRGHIGAYPWFVAACLLPLALMALLRFRAAPDRRSFALLALAVGAISATHTLTVASFLLLVAAACGADWLWRDRSGPGALRVLAVGAACLLGLALSAFALLPALGLLDLVSATEWDHQDGRFNTWFNSFSFPLVTDTKSVPYSWIMPWSCAVLIAGLGWLYWRIEGVPAEAAVLVWMALFAAVLSSELSYPLWSASETFRIFQRPFRFLAPLAAALLVALPLALAQLPQADRRARRAVGVMLAIAIAPLAALHVDYWRDMRMGTARTFVVGPALLDEVFFQPEHLPATAGPGWRDYIDAGGWDTDCKQLDLVCAGGMETAHRGVWQIETPRAVSLRLPLMGYPAWRLSIADTVLAPPIDPETGLYVMDLAPGRHVVTAEWHPLPLQLAGRWISLAALLATMALVLVPAHRRGNAD